MLVGIHKERYGKTGSYLDKYIAILEFNQIPYILLDINDKDFWNQLKKCDAFIFRYMHYDWHHQVAKTILPIIEKELKIPCFPNYQTHWHFDDKIRQYYLMQLNGFPMIESYIFYDRQKAESWIKNADFPLIFKLKGGAGSQNVIKVDTLSHGLRLIKKMFNKGINPNRMYLGGSIKRKELNLKKELIHRAVSCYRKEEASHFWYTHKNYVYFQKFLSGNEYDTRISIIGNRAFAYRRLTRDNDFRASGSGKIRYEQEKIDPRTIDIAFQVSEKFGFQSMAYDFIFDENNQPRFCEISYNFVDFLVRNCPGYQTREGNWVEGHYWPQYNHLVDLLQIPDLQQPEFNF